MSTVCIILETYSSLDVSIDSTPRLKIAACSIKLITLHTDIIIEVASYIKLK